VNVSQRQVIAEKVASTVRVLELLELTYEVTANKSGREKNASPRVVRVPTEDGELRIYNSTRGATWANWAGTPVRDIRIMEDIYQFLVDLKAGNGERWRQRKEKRPKKKAR